MARSAVKYLHGPKEKIPQIIAEGKADADDIIVAESGEGDNFVTEFYYVQHLADGGVKAVPLRSLAPEEIILSGLPTDENGNPMSVAEVIGDLGTTTEGKDIKTVVDYVQEQIKVKEY